MSAVDGRYGFPEPEPDSYRCDCGETVYVAQRARHEAKDHPSPEVEAEVALHAFAVSMTDAGFAKARRVAARITREYGDPGSVKLLDRFGDAHRLDEVAAIRQDVGLATPGWTNRRGWA